MKEDILEQLVEDWFVSKTGWFVKHNIKYRPNRNHPEYDKRKDSSYSDIDILAIKKNTTGIDSVKAVTCKSWQTGVRFNEWIDTIESEIGHSYKSDRIGPRNAFFVF